MAQNLDELKVELYESFNLARSYSQHPSNSISEGTQAEIALKSLAAAAETAKAIIELEKLLPKKKSLSNANVSQV